MKLISWNENGFRAVLGKGCDESFYALDADIFCLPETQMQPEQAVFETEGYWQCWNNADKQGYTGTAVCHRPEPTTKTETTAPGAHGD